ncbi:hypothetical protein BH09PSE4_BH09PSE4_23080 [soil metagenome]
MRVDAVAIAAWIIVAQAAGAAKSPSDAASQGEVSGGRGPYQVVMYADPSLAHHTIYRPARMAAVRGTLPIVAWGEGGCEDKGNRYRHFLSDIASRGFLVIATGNIGARSIETDVPGEPVLPGTPPDINAPAPSSPAELTEAIGWAIARNARKGDPLRGRVDTRHVAVMGHSCGALQALAVASDPRITTVMMLNSGVWTQGTGGLPGARVTKADLARVHGSIAYIGGDRSDVAFDNAKDDFDRLRGIPALRAYRIGVAHKGTYWTEPNGGEFARVSSAWLEWRLKGDLRAAKMFTGAKCGLCADPKWRIERKLIR